MNTQTNLTTQYLLVAERIKHFIQASGPKEPEEILRLLHHRLPPIVPFTVWTMLFTGDLRLNGFGEVVLPSEFEYVQEELTLVPISRPVR